MNLIQNKWASDVLASRPLENKMNEHLSSTLQDTWLTPFQRVALVRDPSTAYATLEDCSSPEAVAKVLHPFFTDRPTECFVVCTLDAKNKLIGITCVHVGTLSMCEVDPRAVFQPAILQNAASIIVAHNHPSGDTAPSPEDVAVTRLLSDAGKMLNITVLDHLIIGYGTFHSLKQSGRMS